MSLYDRLQTLPQRSGAVAVIVVLSAVIIVVGDVLGAFGNILDFFRGAKDTPSPSVLSAPNPDCYYLAVDPFKPADSVELGASSYTIDDVEFRFDGTDVQSPKFFVLKGYTPGPYVVRAHIGYWNTASGMKWIGDLALGESKFYHFKWHPSTHIYSSDTNHVVVGAVPEEQFRSVFFRKDFQVPSCAASPRGVSAGY